MDINERIEALLQRLVDAVAQNVSGVQTTTVVIPAINQSVQLPWIEVLDGFILQVIAWPANPVGSLVLVSRSRAEALSAGQSVALLPGAAIGYRIQNANALWVSATVGGCMVTATCERK